MARLTTCKTGESTWGWAANRNRSGIGNEVYGGYCDNGIAFGIPWGGNAEDFIVNNDKLYICGGTVSKQAFLLNLEKNLALSDKCWKDEVKGNNSF